MTVSEFNEKYKDYLGEGHYGLSIDNQEIIDYLDIIFEDLVKIKEFKYYQIKLKYGYPRVYLTGVSTHMARTIELYLKSIIEDINDSKK